MEAAFMNTSSKKADELQIIAIPIEEGFFSLRGLSPKRIRFELEYALEKGSTDNSFLFTSNDNSNTNDQELIPTPFFFNSRSIIPAKVFS